jgi:hypothetical protein
MTALKMAKAQDTVGMYITCNSEQIEWPDKEEIQLLQHLPVCILLNKAQDLSNNTPSPFSLLPSEPTKAFCNKLASGHTTKFSNDPFYKTDVLVTHENCISFH